MRTFVLKGEKGEPDRRKRRKNKAIRLSNVAIHYDLLNRNQFFSLTPHLVDVYIAAMEYDPSIKKQRVLHWHKDSMEPGFHAILAHDDTSILGIAYGYRATTHHWWGAEIDRGIAQFYTEKRINDHEFLIRKKILNSFFELAEIHVTPQAQGQGIGQELFTRLACCASKINAKHLLLSTPEVPAENNAAFRLYRRLGCTDFLRHFLFTGDNRPFAILHTPLPLDY
ncbi:GNAT family N-acetyltransferase [Corynebacterium sp. sy039]|uniref:GNAT family N-acetyltransferase n=1 Tax=Corynebacterium sp. sy039 TaxID=2599641 RepID=UPI0011B6B401|nr:GNAT family N-acetyltransferase [Corynebacterium sp. sy039]QDZ42927.1 GNAT family N-acetyltransferase [Corynebacterium sp. sy039]